METKKLSVEFMHVCENAIIEQGTGNITVVCIFQNINAENFPALHPTMDIVVGFEGEPGAYEIEFVFSDEKEKILTMPSKFNIGQNRKGNLVDHFVGYSIPRDMKQKIEIKHEGETIFTKYITVNNK